MKKKILCALLCLGLCLGSVQAAETGFQDVREGDWFAPYVSVCVDNGLMKGTGNGNFSPNALLTQAECSAMALRLFMLPRGGDGSFETAPEDAGLLTLTLADGTVLSGYSGEENPFSGWSWHGALAVPVALPGETEEEKETWGKAHEGPAVFHAAGRGDWPGHVTCWMTPNRTWGMEFTANEEFQKDLSAAIQAGLLNGDIPGPDKWWRDAAYTAQQWEAEGLTFSGQSADRTFFVHTLSAVAGEMEAINAIPSLPDTDDSGVLAFYSAGILTGVDEQGTFAGDKTLTRSEAAAMAARILEPSLRLAFTPAQPEAKRDYTLTAVTLPEGWVPTADSQNVAAGWATIQRVENDTVAEEAICRSDGTVLGLEGYFVYGFEHLTSRGDAKRLPVSTHQGVATDLVALFGSVWNIYDVEQERFLLEAGLLGDDPAWNTAWQEYLTAPQTWPQPRLDESAGCYGYVDQEGNWVIPAQYYDAGPFADGAAVVSFPDRTAAAIDKTGKDILPRRYSELWYLGDGVFSYWGDLSSWEGDDWRRDCGTVTMEGIETPTQTFSGHFNGGLAAHHGLVAMGHEADNNWVMAYYDLAGNQVTEDFDWAGPIGDDGAGFVCKGGQLYRIQFPEEGAG